MRQKTGTMKRSIAVLACAAMGVLAAASPALAGGTASVNAQVTLDYLSVTVSGGSVQDFGAVDTNQTKGTSTPLVFKNDGTLKAHLTMYSQLPTNREGDSWDLGPAQGADAASLDVLCSETGCCYGNLDDTVGLDLGCALAPGEEHAYDVYLNTPTSVSSGGTFSWDMYVVATQASI